jgi:hypothetical protein
MRLCSHSPFRRTRIASIAAMPPWRIGAFSRAATIVERLAGEIEDEALKEGFLSAPQLRHVLEATARKP